MVTGMEPHDFATMLPGVSSPKKGNPCAVAVNIYNKTRIRMDFTAGTIAPYAGKDIDVEVAAPQGGNAVIVQNVRGRLIAPGYSLGNAFLDDKTIPIEERKKYLSRSSHSRHPFDALAYAADYA